MGKDLVFGYVRSSTLEEVRQGSNERQKELLKKWADYNGYNIQIFEDKAISGTTDNRKGLNKMWNSIYALKPKAVIVTKIDRFARSLKDLSNRIDTLDKLNIGFVAVEQSGMDTTTPTGRLLLQILGAFAEFEVTMIRERTKAGIEAAKIKGTKFGRPAFKTSIKNGGKFINGEMVIDYYTKGLSVRAIAKAMGCSRTPIEKIVSHLKVPSGNKV